MPHIFGDHNDPILQLYTGRFDTEDGPINLECWSMEPVDAVAAFRRFFSDDHPERPDLADKSRLAVHDRFSPDWNEVNAWWRGIPIASGDEIRLYINPGTRVKVGKTVVEYAGSHYLTWSRAYRC